MEREWSSLPSGVSSPFPHIDMIAGGQEEKLSGLFCAVLCATIVHSALYTHKLTDLAFFWIISCCSLLVYVCFCCVRFSFFSTMPRDWLGRMSPK